jgi:CheY-like chemotaxis protein
LREAQARLEDADRRKNEFLAMLSHELRNPLTPVKTSLYILDRVAPDSEHAKRANAVIRRQVDQLSRLVDDLLDVTRITRGKIHLRRERVDLVELVRTVAEDHRPLFERADITLEVTLSAVAVSVHADRSRIAQIVGNLLQNAVKFTQPGGRVGVGVSMDAAAGVATLTVEDSGAGMAPEVLDRLFEPFMQADHTLDRSKGGLGLGLALVRGLVTQHGGSVTATSEGLGRGSRFVVRLPLASAKSADPAPAGAGHPAGRRRVLVIEDNVDAAESMRALLELHGHEVSVAHTGPDGVAKAVELRPEVVLCDIGLPGMDGFRLVEPLRAKLKGTPVVFAAVTGYASAEDQRRALDAGFDSFFVKPLNPRSLANLLRSYPGRAD